MRHFRHRDAKKVQKQLQSVSKASQKRSRGRLLRQKDFKECPTIGSGPINGVVSIQPTSRNGRTTKTPGHFDGK
jgi:N-methylhydantoinase A/oxoprolinase/acetone carboxylase beta subunit